MTAKQNHCILLTIVLLNLLLYAGAALGNVKLLIDFGGSEGGNQYNSIDFPGWNNVLFSSHTNYTSNSPEGLTMVSGTDTYDNWQSISGPALTLNAGDTIIVTWYNGTGGTISLWRPLISFTDSDNPSETSGEPQWYAMDRYGNSLSGDSNVNYLYDGSTVQTVYTMTSPDTAPGTAPPSAGSHILINISNRNSNYRGLILDKIEIVRRSETTPLAPVNPMVQRDANLPHSAIELNWEIVAPVGGVPIDHYRIYRNGRWVGKSTTDSFTDYNLECNTNYSYTVEAVNTFRTKSDHSVQVSQRTGLFDYGENVLDPNLISYLGAFRFPTDTQNSSWNYRRGQMAYYPLGDPGNIDGDTDFPGSLYATGHTYDKMAAEITIPQPVISSDVNDLPFAQTLQNFHVIEPDNIYDTNYVSIGLTYLSRNSRFYSTFYYWYNVSFNKMITHGSFKADFSDVSGGWWVGDADELRTPHYDTYAKYLAEIPFPWASANTPEKFLLSGGQRGGSSPDGPGLVAVKAWGSNQSDMPAPGAELEYTTLLAYENGGMNIMNGYIGCDYFDGVAWVENGRKSAVVFAGEKSYGEYYYGFRDGTIYGEVVDNVPRSTGTDGAGKGGRARSFRPMLIFYDPADLARVAKSQQGIYLSGDPLYMEPYEPQPYAAVDIGDYLLQSIPDDPSGGGSVESVTYDKFNNYLFVAEQDALPNSADIIHVFKIGDSARSSGSNIFLLLPPAIFER